MAKLKRPTMVVLAIIRNTVRALLSRDNYRPELHYMRGPGPKWRARHASLRK